MTSAWALLLLLVTACAPAPAPDAPAASEVQILGVPASSDSPRPMPIASARPRQSLPGHWYASEDEAIALAREEGRPLIVDFAATWCVACKELQERTFADPRVIAGLDRFVLLRLDASDDEDPKVRAALSKYSVLGLPAVLLVDSTGTEARRFTEFVAAEAMRVALDDVR